MRRPRNSNPTKRSFTWQALVGCLVVLAGHGARVRAEEGAFFRQKVAPLLEERCLRCHGPKVFKGGLSLATEESAREGGDSGPAIVPGKPKESLLLDMVSGNKPKMPREGPRLTASEVALLRKWIEKGAHWPRGLALRPRKFDAKTWWSLKPLVRPGVPTVKNADWLRTPIDAFILNRLEREGLAPSPEADRRTLIRRLYFDLLGLPPTPTQVVTFLGDRSPNAYERLVDRLLASPHYGERWARHWLDVVHYGDTHGYDKDKLRPNAWPYRDYVIRAFNEDKPYNQFIKEQLAGDVFYPGTRDGIVALGFLAAGPWDFVGQVELREGTLDKAITRNLDRDDMVATVMNTFTGLTVQCARCHDHKFDPITQEDYYSLQAVFAGVDRADRPFDSDADTARQRACLGQRQAELKARRLAAAAAVHQGAGPKLADIERGLKDTAARLAALPPPGLVYAAATDFPAAGSFTPTGGKPRPIYLLRRGSENNPARAVGPGTVACVSGLEARFAAGKDRPESERRAALARWIIDRRNPLTWRSLVNRVWHYHFGRGLVDTPNDFGRMGGRPSHPELLDWLAVELRDRGQSIKTMHRLILTSATYRQASAHHEAHARVDGANRWWWRMNRQRLDAEAVRDAVLEVSGKLDRRLYGPGFRPFGFKDDHSPHYKYEEHDPDDPATLRRSIYRFLVRSVPDPFMETLDCADPSLRVEKRNQTLTALQALALLNNKFMVRMAGHFALRAEKMGHDLRCRITTAYRLALGRAPAAEELQVLTGYARKHGLPNTCRLILNMNEFSFVD